MSALNRRELVTAVAGIVSTLSLPGLSTAVSEEIQAQPPKITDEILHKFKSGSVGIRLSKPTVFKLDEDDRSRDLIFSNVLDEYGRTVNSFQKQGTVRIFRPAPDDFRKDPVLNWKYNRQAGHIKLEDVLDVMTNGPIVMVIREIDGTVRCYTLTYDLRC